MVNNTKIQLRQSDLAVDKMTLLLGARCADGVVLAADHKLTGLYPGYGDKITGELTGILTGFSGEREKFVLFTIAMKKYVNNYLASKKENVFETPYPSINSLIWEINQIKSELYSKFDVLMAVSGDYFKDKKSQLHHFFDTGGCVPINSVVTAGSGGPYCSYLMKNYFGNEMNMRQFAQLADFAIRFVSDPEYDYTQGEVGLDPKHPYPQIHYIPDDPNFCKPYNNGKPKPDCKPSLKELKQFKTKSEKKLKSLYNLALKF